MINLPGIAGTGGPNSLNVVVPVQAGQQIRQVLEYYGSARFVYAAGSNSSGDIFIGARQLQEDLPTVWPKLKFGKFSTTTSADGYTLVVEMQIHVVGKDYGLSVPFHARFHR